MHVKDLKAASKPNFMFEMDPAEIGSGVLDWKRLLPWRVAMLLPLALSSTRRIQRNVALLTEGRDAQWSIRRAP